MKIAVTYENGEVFQHFGHTEQFKLYEVSGGKLLQTQVVDTNGSGHGALAGLLAQLGVDTLICGGIGGGAQAALAAAGILMTAVNSYAVWDIGFELSFAAVAGTVAGGACSRRMRDAHDRHFWIKAGENLQKPVIFTGAQIAMVDPDTDGKKNLLDAVHAAVSGIPGVYVVFGGRIIRGIRAQKMYTRALDAFHSINAGDAGYVQDGEVFLNQSVPTPVGEPVLDTRLEPKVVQLKLLPGIEPKQLESMLGMGYYGIILEAFGCGGIPNQNRNLLPCLKRAKQFGVAVLVATQCKYGNVDLGVKHINKKTAREGAMSVYDMSIEAAAVKLMWVLGHTKKLDEVKKMMETCYVGEFTEKRHA